MKSLSNMRAPNQSVSPFHGDSFAMAFYVAALVGAVITAPPLRAASVIEFQRRSFAASELDGPLTIALSCRPPAPAPIRILVRAVGGSAQCPADFYPCELALETRSGSEWVVGTVFLVDDGLPESSEAVIFEIAEIGSACNGKCGATKAIY